MKSIKAIAALSLVGLIGLICTDAKAVEAPYTGTTWSCHVSLSKAGGNPQLLNHRVNVVDNKSNFAAPIPGSDGMVIGSPILSGKGIVTTANIQSPMGNIVFGRVGDVDQGLDIDFYIDFKASGYSFHYYDCK